MIIDCRSQFSKVLLYIVFYAQLMARINVKIILQVIGPKRNVTSARLSQEQNRELQAYSAREMFQSSV